MTDDHFAKNHLQHVLRWSDDDRLWSDHDHLLQNFFPFLTCNTFYNDFYFDLYSSNEIWINSICYKTEYNFNET